MHVCVRIYVLPIKEEKVFKAWGEIKSFVQDRTGSKILIFKTKTADLGQGFPLDCFFSSDVLFFLDVSINYLSARLSAACLTPEWSYFLEGRRRKTHTPQTVLKTDESTHSAQADLSLPTPGELAGQVVQHGTSTFAGLAEVRAVLPPVPPVFWTCQNSPLDHSASD